MPLKVPLTYHSDKIEKTFRVFWEIITFAGWLLYPGLIIYFSYKYYLTNKQLFLGLSLGIFGGMLYQIYDWNKNRRKI